MYLPYNYTQAGFDPLFAEGAGFTEWKTDALANQTTTAEYGNTLPRQYYHSDCLVFNVLGNKHSETYKIERLAYLSLLFTILI